MSELISKVKSHGAIRWKLLTGVSTLALAVYVSSARAADTEQPPVWITLDGQFAQRNNSEGLFAPPFLFASPFDGTTGLEKAPSAIWNEGAKLVFWPEGTDWVLSAAIQFGRASRSESRNQNISHVPYKYFYKAYQSASSYSKESHAILDFQAGKDLGLGSFGSGGKSTLSAGIRIAQFNSRTHVEIKSQPTNCGYCGYYRFYASLDSRRSFRGIGPSLSWDASVMIAGNSSDGGIALDWGVNGAVLFGRQKVLENHQTTKNHLTHSRFSDYSVYQNSAAPALRGKNVTVPNLGGFAGVSWRYPNAQVSLGYRADFFFGAMDQGIDSTRRETVGFFGPFASISIGFGG